ncbi:MAG TPA: alanine racemase [Candidatus Baltobacteraceae bacterium]|jgi:alanine racemase|nr:alanine racemase [Candidatus Baltobacteraceae bacterium]
MQPDLSLDLATVQANARAWRIYAGVPVYAVLKADGYGWGIGPLARALEDFAQAYCVSDADELAQLRRYSAKRAIVLNSVEPDRLAQVLHSNASPTISNATEFELARTILTQADLPLDIRIGLRPAPAWSGSSLDDLRSLAPALAAAGARVQLWTHFADWERRAQLSATLKQAERFMREVGVDLTGVDVASTFSLAADGPCGDAVRIGIGLFGATGGAPVSGVRCALRLRAPVLRVQHHPAGTRLGYGGTMLRMGETIATARCGYADGLPNALAGADDILSIGMQYLTVRASRLSPERSELVVLDANSDLDILASRARRLPHEIVTAFGNCARANGVSVEV